MLLCYSWYYGHLDGQIHFECHYKPSFMQDYQLTGGVEEKNRPETESLPFQRMAL